MRILVAGQSKTGTSALWSAIQASLPPGYRFAFEPASYSENHSDVLVKAIIGYGDFSGYSNFERKILIVRDPRDTIVSRVCYAAYDLPGIYNSAKHSRWWLTIIEHKTREPRFIDMFELFSWLIRFADARQYLNHTMDCFDYVCQWDTTGYHVIKYEDFVARKWSGLEEYLGFKITWNGSVLPQVRRVKRRITPDDWQNWFTELDVHHFFPWLHPYISQFGYPIHWELAEEPFIDPKHSVEYVSFLLAKRAMEKRK